MKLKNLLLGMMACATMLACSNEEKENSGDNNITQGDAAYVSLNISMIGGDDTRATAGDEAEGLAGENGISTIAILFYNGDNLVQTVTESDLSGLNGGNVDNYKNALIALKNPAIVPTSVVAILNPSTTTFPASLSALKSQTDYVLNTTEDNKFTMTNSTFYNADGSIQMEVPVSPANVATSPDAAKLNPVTISVERAVAKITPEVSGNLRIVLDNQQIDGANANLTASVIGWNLSGTNKSSYILKNMEQGWFNLSWVKGVNRSFWAKDPNYVAASTTRDNLNFSKFPTTKTPSLYCLENTFDNYNNNPEAATHLVVSAQIKVNGTAVNIYDYLGQKYTETSVKNLMSTNANISQYYVEDPSGLTIGGKKYVSFKPDFIELTAKGAASYKVKATLTAAASAMQFYTLDAAKTTATAVNKSVVEKALADLGDVSKYNEGRCYYYVSIEHFGGNGVGDKGVVRNHVYKILINSITGFGTAVPNPDDIIIPEKPTKDDYYVAAKVEVLKWKTVNQVADLQ